MFFLEGADEDEEAKLAREENDDDDGDEDDEDDDEIPNDDEGFIAFQKKEAEEGIDETGAGLGPLQVTQRFAFFTFRLSNGHM
jgi:hypothetical protein